MKKFALYIPLIALATGSAMATGTGPLDDAASVMSGMGTPVTAALAAAAGVLAIFVAYKFLKKIFGA